MLKIVASYTTSSSAVGTTVSDDTPWNSCTARWSIAALCTSRMQCHCSLLCRVHNDCASQFWPASGPLHPSWLPAMVLCGLSSLHRLTLLPFSLRWKAFHIYDHAQRWSGLGLTQQLPGNVNVWGFPWLKCQVVDSLGSPAATHWWGQPSQYARTNTCASALTATANGNEQQKHPAGLPHPLFT